jgi:hypothetical protein
MCLMEFKSTQRAAEYHGFEYRQVFPRLFDDPWQIGRGTAEKVQRRDRPKTPAIS